MAPRPGLISRWLALAVSFVPQRRPWWCRSYSRANSRAAGRIYWTLIQDHPFAVSAWSACSSLLGFFRSK